MKIGTMQINSSPALALAPMAGYTNVAFRTLIAERGADLVFSELISAAALSRAFRKKAKLSQATASIMQVGESGISGIQIFGSNSQEISDAVLFIKSLIESGECKARLIDINFGCPAKKVVKTGSGSALLEDERKIEEIASAAAKAGGEIPISAKIRLGYKTKNNVAIARILERAGISALSVHGRTAAQKFSGKSDWKSIKEVVEAVSIPVFGNGDVMKPEDVMGIMEACGCQGVMIGRAALSNPFIFIQARQFLQTGKYEKFSWNEKIEFISQYLKLQQKFGLSYESAKKLALHLAKGFQGSAKMRQEIMKAKNADALLEIMKKY